MDVAKILASTPTSIATSNPNSWRIRRSSMSSIDLRRVAVSASIRFSRVGFTAISSLLQSVRVEQDLERFVRRVRVVPVFPHGLDLGEHVRRRLERLRGLLCAVED